jgi:hypothetical protein
MYLGLCSTRAARLFVNNFFSSARALKACIFPHGGFDVELKMNPEYWVNLGKSAVFKEHILFDCLSRIHLDIIEVWNFYDPEKVSFNRRLLRS